MSNALLDRELGPLMQYWARASDPSLDIAGAHMKEADNIFERGGVVEGHEALRSFRFIRGDTLLRHDRFPSYDEVASDLVTRVEGSARPYFVSHRWLTPEHPDPEGRHASLLKTVIQSSDLCWIDYCCLPQGPERADEVRTSLQWLLSLMIDAQTLVIRTAGDGYEPRAWCILESLASQLVSGGRGRRLLLSDVDEHAVTGWESSLLDGFMLDGRLPLDTEVTFMQDLQPLQRASESLLKMADVNLLHHYMGLGQKLTYRSEDESPLGGYFMATAPFYLVGECDLTNLRRWTRSACLSFGLDFSIFSSTDEFNQETNAFVKMAKAKQFRHDVNVYQLPPIATLSSRNLHWLVDNRKSDSSETNLFYILTSLLTLRGEKVPEFSMSGVVNHSSSPQLDSSMSQQELELQISHQNKLDRDRLSIEINCTPGSPRPWEVLDLVVYLTEMRPDDFVKSNPMFGRQQFLVKPAMDAIARYLRSRKTIKCRLLECYERGLVRGATW